ncbi:Hypothetical predicted protein [Paramuricea clavata]|uniref:Uncharacterized protein n=1 Tax=Paramuricea clavata TaxID=317549 RepID=A0A7D9IMG4_PARCT|nr:Hypothetical predicted protein [Paramuricea clavata]
MSNEVTRRLTRFLDNPLEQTGFRSLERLELTRRLGSIEHHTGVGVTNSITECVKIYDINRSQYLGGSFDGAYYYCYFGFEGNKRKHHDWDPLHKAGLQDIHIRKDPTFEWLVSTTKIIGEVFKVVNYGKEFEHLFSVAKEMKESGEADISFKTPELFSETRFANHARKVYVSFREDFPAIIRTLEEVQLENMEGNSDDRKKATHASDLLDKILNTRFTVRLSGLCDIYEVFGHGVNILQTVDMLPHDKFDRFHSVVIGKFNSMTASLDHATCISSYGSKCQWPTLHRDLEEIKTIGSYRGIPMAQSYGEEINTRMGERRAARNARDEQQGIVIIVKAQQDLQKLVQRMYECLHNKVYHEGDKSMLKTLRPIIDLSSLALKVKQKSAAHVLALDGEQFTKVSKQLATNIDDVPDSEIRIQFREFIRRLDVAQLNEEDLCSIKLIKVFLETERKLYVDIEMVMHVI